MPVIRRVSVCRRIKMRRTDLAELSFEEERRQIEVIPRSMSERWAMKLASTTMIRSAERWYRASASDLERDQLRLLRVELDPSPAEDTSSSKRRLQAHRAP